MGSLTSLKQLKLQKNGKGGSSGEEKDGVSIMRGKADNRIPELNEDSLDKL